MEKLDKEPKMKKHKHKMDKETKCVHNGTTIDTITRGDNTPIFPSTAHEYLDSENSAYPRHFNTLN